MSTPSSGLFYGFLEEDGAVKLNRPTDVLTDDVALLLVFLLGV